MFRVGQKVIYITGRHMPKYSRHTVLELYETNCGENLIRIGRQVPRSPTGRFRCTKGCCVINFECDVWKASSFCPIDDSFGHQIASEIEEEINQEQLVIK